MLQISRTNERPVNNNLCFKYVQKQLKMKTIAIIDDDIHIGDMLTEILTREGYGILRAYSGTEALYLLYSLL